MVIIDDNLKNKSGIYCILNIQNNKKYIGSSKNIWQRLQKHFSLLRKNKHENIILQNSFNKNGEDSFICFCLREHVLENLTYLEQYYIDLLKPQYNITKEVVRNILSEESRIKISETLKRRYAEGLPITKHKEIDVYTTNGQFVNTYFSITDCSKELNIHESSINRVLKGKMQQCKGYIFYNKGETNIKIISINPNTNKPYKKQNTSSPCKTHLKLENPEEDNQLPSY